MPIVNFINEKKQIQVPEGANLRQEALKAGIGLYKGINKYLNCVGFGLCGTCRVRIVKGMENASEMGALERINLKYHPKELFSYIGNEDTMRLSCQTQVLGDMDVETRPALNLYGEPFFK